MPLVNPSKYLLIKVRKMKVVRDRIYESQFFIANSGYDLKVDRAHTCSHTLIFVWWNNKETWLYLKLCYGQNRYNKMIRIHEVLLKLLGNYIAKCFAGPFSKHTERYTPKGFLPSSRGFLLPVMSHHNNLGCILILLHCWFCVFITYFSSCWEEA